MTEEPTPAPHQHSPGPHRCCPDESPESVLLKLRRSPPKRQGYPTKHGTGWNGESPEALQVRTAAWEQAIAREEEGLAAAKIERAQKVQG